MRYLVVPLALVALSLSGCQGGTQAAAQGDGGVSNSARVSASPTATPSLSSSPRNRVISPNLQAQTTCAVVPGRYLHMTKGVRFTAKSTVVNEGDIGANVRLEVTWSGSSVIHRVQRFVVGYGQSKTVTFNAPTTPSGAAAYKAYGPRNCEATVRVLALVGSPSPTK